MKQNNVIPECYVDTNLISTLIGADANHQKGCNSVARILQTQKKDDFAIGIIDKDKKRPGYVDEFELLAQRDHLELYKHPTKPHYFILVVKAVETLLLENAKVLGLDLKAYGLTSNFNEFKKLTKRCESNKDPRFTRLVIDLRLSPEIGALEESLNYMVAQKYAINVEELKRIFLK